MKAIEILFNEIDKINTELKNEKEISDKLHCVAKIKKIISAIDAIAEIKNDRRWSDTEYI